MQTKTKVLIGTVLVCLVSASGFLGKNLPRARAMASEWEQVGSTGAKAGGTDFVTLKFKSLTGEPYLALSDEDNGEKATVIKYSGSSWEAVGARGFSVGKASYTNLAFNPSTDEPYVIYSDDSSNYLTPVKKFNGSNWEEISGSSALTAYWLPGVEFNPGTNELYAIYPDAMDSNRVRVVKHNGSGWENVGATGLSSGTSNRVYLAFNPLTYEAYAAFLDNDVNYDVVVKKFNGGSWETLGNTGLAPGLTMVDFAFAVNPVTGEPYVAVAPESAGYKLTVKKWNGSSWEVVGGENFSPPAVMPCLGFNPATNDLYIAYSGSDYSWRPTLMKYRGGISWEQIGLYTGGASTYNSLAFNPLTSEPYIAYVDDAAADEIKVIKFDRGVDTDTPILNYNISKKAKKNIVLTFDDLAGARKEGMKVRLGGKSVKVRSVRNSGNNLRVVIDAKYYKWARGYYGLTMSYKKKTGKKWVKNSFSATGVLRVQ